jgi:putative ABC transport system ATP-binding protein
VADDDEQLRLVDMTTAIAAADLYRFYHIGDDETLALRGVSVSADTGEMVAVVGPSGSGKSTLLACLAGLDEPDGGMVWINGARMSRRSEAERARIRARSIGILFQTANLIEHLTVLDNMLLAQRLAHSVDRAVAAEVLERLAMLERARAHPSELSGGEMARAGLAVALANQPDVVLADEPTGELDSSTAVRVIDELRAAAERGAAVVTVTHNDELARLADRVVELRDGRVIG